MGTSSSGEAGEARPPCQRLPCHVSPWAEAQALPGQGWGMLDQPTSAMSFLPPLGPHDRWVLGLCLVAQAPGKVVVPHFVWDGGSRWEPEASGEHWLHKQDCRPQRRAGRAPRVTCHQKTSEPDMQGGVLPCVSAVSWGADAIPRTPPVDGDWPSPQSSPRFSPGPREVQSWAQGHRRGEGPGGGSQSDPGAAFQGATPLYFRGAFFSCYAGQPL